MSEFKVRIPSLNGAMDSVQTLESILQQAADGVISVKRNLRVQIRQRERIDSRLTNSARRLENQRNAVGRAVSTGRQIAGFYQETEERLLSEPHKSSKPFDFQELLTIDNLKKLVGEAGVFGSAVSAIWSIVTGDQKGASKNSFKTVGNIGKIMDAPEVEVSWKHLLGLNVRSSKPGTWTEAWGKEIGKYKIGKGQSAGKNTAAAAKWAGNIITVVTTGADNWEEFENDGGFQNPRFYAETALESGITIGTGLAIGTAVALCTPVGWTTLAVGAATVATTAVVNWALDGVSYLITGNEDGWVENLSDGIIGGVNWIGEKVGEAAKKVGDSIAAWWNDLWS